MITRRLLMILMFVFIGLSAKAQPPTWQWARTATNIGIYTDNLGIATDLTGNIYVTGLFLDSLLIFGMDTLIGDLTHDMFYLVKYDSSGNVIYTRGAIGEGYGQGITTDALGNIYTTGYFGGQSIIFGSDTLFNNSSSYYNLFTVKYNSSGVVQWVRGAQGEGHFTEGTSIATDTFGNVFISGISTSPYLIFGSDTLNMSTNGDIFIVKYDTSGNVIFAKTAIHSLNSAVSTACSSLCTDMAGNAYIAGITSNIYSLSQPTSITFDAITLVDSVTSFSFIVKYSSSGSALWARKPNGTGNWSSSGYSIASNNLGKIYTTGWYTGSSISFGSNAITNYGVNNVFLTKYDSSGNVIYARDIGGTDSDYGFCVASDNYDNVYLTGEAGSYPMNFDTILQVSTGGTIPMFFAKYNSTGHATFAMTFQDGGDDIAPVSIDHFGNVYISGDFEFVNPFVIGPDSLPLSGDIPYHEAFFLAKLRFPSGSNDGIPEIKPQQTLLLSPNPFTTQATLTIQGIKNENQKSLSVYNLLGQVVQNIFVGKDKEVIIHRNNLPSGMYFYKLIDDSKTVLGMGKMVVE